MVKQMIGRAEKVGHGQVVRRPRFLRAAVEPRVAQQQHQRLEHHSAVGPLRRPVRALDIAEQAYRSAEEAIVVAEPRQPSVAVAAFDAQRRVHRFADLKPAAAIGLAELLGIDGVFRAVAERRLGKPRFHPRLERRHSLAGEQM